MLRLSRRGFSTAIATIDSLIASRNMSEVSKALCGLKPSDSVSEEQWHSVVNKVISAFRSSNTPLGEAKSNSVIPSVLIASASLGHGLSSAQKADLIDTLEPLFTNLSVFDKSVFVIGCSQVGVRTPKSVHLINQFLSQDSVNVPDKLLVPVLLAVSNLAISNERGWNELLSRIDIERLRTENLHELANLALAIATSKRFPISALERIMDSAAPVVTQFAFDDALSLLHSLTCLELFRVDLVRGLLNRISQLPVGPTSVQKILLKQILLSLWLDPKAADVVTVVAPQVWQRMSRIVTYDDWSVPETTRHHGLVAGEIQELLNDLGDTLSDEDHASSGKAISVPFDYSTWSPSIACSVATDRFYLSDVPLDESQKLFVHIDDETYPDIDDGPIDPVLQVKHAQIKRCGWKLLWVKESEWEDMSNEEKRESIRRFLARE